MAKIDFQPIDFQPEEQAQESPTMRQQVGRALIKAGDWMGEVRPGLAKALRPTLEMGGMVAGGALASPGVATTAFGAGLGYAAGKRAADAIETFAGAREDKGLVEEGLQSAASLPGDVAEGAVMELGGQVINKGMQAVISKVAKAAPRIYESVLKAPPKTISKASRDAAVQTALDKEIAPTEKGLKKLEGLIDTTNEEISSVIKENANVADWAIAKNKKLGYKAYDEGTIKTKDVLTRLDDLADDIRNREADPREALDMIKAFKKSVKEYRGPEISVAKAQELKQGVYSRLKGKYGELKSDEIEMRKTFARGLKEEIVNKLPELQKLNADDSALYNLENVLERAVSRTRNWDLIGLTDVLGSGVGGAIGGARDGWEGGSKGAAIGLATTRILRSPAVMSKLAFALNKAAKIEGAPILSKAMSYATSKKAKPVEGAIKELAPALSPAYAEASPLSEASGAESAIRRRQQAIDEAAADQPTTRTPIPQARTAQETTRYEAPAKVKQRASDGAWVKWDDYNQAWVKMNAQEITAYKRSQAI